MKDAIIGYTGFVGSYLSTQITADLYNSKNIQDICGKEYDTIYFAGLPATKWLANKNPEKDLQNILNIQTHLQTCSIKCFVLISTIDVYNKHVPNQDEDGTAFTQESYGKHRRLFELWITENYENHHIIRLPALFGLGLKKNVIFDMLTNNRICKINPNDMFQWYYLDDLYHHIKIIISCKIQCINLFSEPISMKDLLFINPTFPIYEDNDLPGIIYNFKTNMYSQTKQEILTKIIKFITLFKCIKEKSNQLVVSNLCWNDNTTKALALLDRYEIKNVELAVTKYTDWYATLYSFELIKKLFNKYEIYSLQALFFSLSYNVFIDTENFINHFKHIANICNILNVKRLVFGSPINRKVPDKMSVETATSIFVKTFQEISTFLPEHVILCIEHNAEQYNCNFLTHIAETISIVKDINRPNILMNLDTGNALMMNDCIDFETIKDYVGHIQVSAPNLGSILKNPNVNFNEYVGKISLEMKPTDNLEEELLAFIKLLS